MLEQGCGQIVFVSSMAGLTGIYGYSAYCASKFAVTGFALALRQELAGSGVSVHLVCPPEVATPMIAAEAEGVLPQTRLLKDLVGTLSPETAAVKIARGIARRKRVIVPGFRAGIVAWAARHFPGLFDSASNALLRWRFG
jgi:short-subunit dehydrogenase